MKLQGYYSSTQASSIRAQYGGGAGETPRMMQIDYRDTMGRDTWSIYEIVHPNNSNSVEDHLIANGYTRQADGSYSAPMQSEGGRHYHIIATLSPVLR